MIIIFSEKNTKKIYFCVFSEKISVRVLDYNRHLYSNVQHNHLEHNAFLYSLTGYKTLTDLHIYMYV